MHQVWRLSEYCDDNFGLACTDAGLFLGRTPLIERHGARFAMRKRTEIERLLSRAYGEDLTVDRLLPGLATVTAALNASDPGLARIAAVHLRIPDVPDQAARDRMEAEDILVKLLDRESARHVLGATPLNPGATADINAVATTSDRCVGPVGDRTASFEKDTRSGCACDTPVVGHCPGAA